MTSSLATLAPAAQRQMWSWRLPQLERFDPVVKHAVINRVREIDLTDYVGANQATIQLSGELTAAHLAHAFDEQAIRDHAENYARLCARMTSLESRASFATYNHVEAPAGLGVSRDGAAQRLDDPLWWRRQLRKTWTRKAENAMRDLGMVRKGRAPYASDLAVRHRAAQKRRMREFLQGHIIRNECDEQLPLLEIAQKSLANPALRRGEFMVRVRGFEEIARDLKHPALFVTLTAPSFFHAQLASGGRNPRFQRAVVRDAQSWLCKMWARARAKLKRLSILVYGFRIAEPHHDATPHWHCLLFVSRSHLDTVSSVLSGVFLSEFGDEPGARAKRVHFERINPAKGSPSGYLAKYISKNIDGEGEISGATDFETDTRILEGIQRVDAWASVHGIRQFQQIGGPPVGLWREARRLRDPVSDPDIERARRCADAGDWRGFVACVGGIHDGRRTNIKVEKVEAGDLNRYGEHRPARIVGLRCASAVVLTRPHTWRIERAECSTARYSLTCPKCGGHMARCACGKSSSSPIFSPLGPVAITVRGAPNYNEPTSWTNPNETSQAGP